MDITHYLLQQNMVNQDDNDIELFNSGHLIQSGKKSYYISFHGSIDNANTELNKALLYSCGRIRYQESELNNEIINCVDRKYKSLDPEWLNDLYECQSFEDLEQIITEYITVEHDEYFCFESIVDDAKCVIADKLLTSIYKVGPIAQIGSDIKLAGINTILDLIENDSVLRGKYLELHEKLLGFHDAAEKTKQTIEILDVEEKEFANIFLVADKTVVSKWCNAVRKPDNFRLTVMDYIIENPKTKLIQHLVANYE